MPRLLRRWLVTGISAAIAFMVGVALAFVVRELRVDLSLREPIRVILKGSSQVPEVLPLEVYPGEAKTFEFIVQNSAPIAYGMTYTASIAQGAYSDLEVTLELDPDGRDGQGSCHYTVTVSKERERSVRLDPSQAPMKEGGEHCLRVTIRPLKDADASEDRKKRTLKIEFQRGP